MRKAIPYGRQQITEQDIQAVTATLKGDYLTQGPKIAEFEKAFADYVGAKYAIAVNNGTTALHLCAVALGTNEKSRVLTTPITFAASANCVLYCGGTVDFADIHPNTYLIDENKIEENLKANKYDGIIAVDFAGLPTPLNTLKKIADKYGCWLIEDACHAPGGYFIDSENKKQYCGNGNFADLAVFSFHPVKHIACGEGGMITTNNEDLYKKIILLRTHGITKDETLMTENHGGWYYEMKALGYNYRMPDILAALGRSQLQRAEVNMQRRQVIADIYRKELANVGDLVIPYVPQNNFHAYHLFVVKTKKRLELYNYLKANEIYSQVHYIPVHLLPYYKNRGFAKGDYPIAEQYYEQCLSLPMYHSLTDDELEYVISIIKKFFAQ